MANLKNDPAVLELIAKAVEKNTAATHKTVLSEVKVFITTATENATEPADRKVIKTIGKDLIAALKA